MDLAAQENLQRAQKCNFVTLFTLSYRGKDCEDW